MTKRRSRIAALGRPLVAIAAASASAAGCYGAGPGDSACPPGAACNPPPQDLECPADVPAQGEACLTAEVCTYGQDDGPGCPPEVHTADCADGVWLVVTATATCNPPAPDLECPPEVPDVGTPCETTDSCWYGEPCGAEPEYSVTCQAGQWSVQPIRSSCNPPPPDADAGV